MRVTDPVLAEHLCNFQVRRHLGHFVGRENTAAGVAAILGVSTQRMIYWINKLLKCGLLKFVRFEKRGNRRIAVYSSSEPEYVVPLAIISNKGINDFVHSSSVAVIEQLNQSFAKSFINNAPMIQLRIGYKAVGPFLSVEDTRDPLRDGTGGTCRSHQLSLNDDEVAQLQVDIKTLFDRYYALSDKSKKRATLIYIGFAEDRVEIPDL
jgi:hypothetical protein